MTYCREQILSELKVPSIRVALHSPLGISFVLPMIVALGSSLDAQGWYTGPAHRDGDRDGLEIEMYHLDGDGDVVSMCRGSHSNSWFFMLSK